MKKSMCTLFGASVMPYIHEVFKGKISVSFRIALYISIAFSFILLLISVMVLSSVHLFLLKESKQFLLYNEKIIRNELKNSPGDEIKTLNELTVSKKVQASLYSINGKLLFIKNRMFPDILIGRDGVKEMRLPDTQDDQEYDRYEQKGNANDLHFMVLRYTVNESGSKYIIQITKDLSEEDYFIFILVKFLIITNIAGLIIAVAIGFLISRRVLSPITRVTDTALHISAKELTARIPDTGPEDELKKLALAFNSMLDRLDDSFKRQNRFVSDASHELKTPLSIINGYVGILSRWGKDDPRVLSESLDAIKSETGRMASLIDKLLFLAKNEDGVSNFKKESLDLGLLLYGIKKDAAILFPGRKFKFKMGKRCMISGNNDILRQMFLVFLDNAGKYSNKNGSVIFSLAKEKENIFVTIEDEGPGIEEEKLKYIFDRFYRLDDARDKVSGGAGLGLSIAKEIIEFHGGSVKVESRKGRNTIFTLYFPAIEKTGKIIE